ncbi:MAG: hypothetical protein NPIRA04_12070 [Nitrospirales bacterium]|nr:MAG: hypothetical protein NPIRA04_12070 [Nitrospirales bacterium]
MSPFALFVLWIVGRVAVQQQWQAQDQSNTRRSQAVLSLIMLGRYVLWRGTEAISVRHVTEALTHLQRQLKKIHAG